MIETPQLIDALVADAGPVRRVRPAPMRTALWLLGPIAIFALLALAHGVRPDLGVRLRDPTFAIGVAGSLLTAVLAALAAFELDLPDRSRAWAWVPLPAAIAWAASIGHGCLVNWVEVGPGGMQAGETARCFATVLLTGLPLAAAMFAMLRHAARLGRIEATLMGSVAVAAMSASAMSVFHQLDASAMVLMWNFGLAAVIVALGTGLGSRMAGR